MELVLVKDYIIVVIFCKVSNNDSNDFLSILISNDSRVGGRNDTLKLGFS